LGCYAGIGYIAKNPERVRKVVLAEPGMLTTEKAKEYMQKFKIEMDWSTLKALTRTVFESLHLKDADKQARIDYISEKIGILDSEGNPMRKYFCDEDMNNGYLPFWRLSGVASQAIMKKGMDEKGNITIDLIPDWKTIQKRFCFWQENAVK